MTKKTRRSPEELAAHHKELADKYALAVALRSDPSLKKIDKMVDDLADIAGTDPRFAEGTDMHGVIAAANDAVCALHDALTAE